MQIKLTSKKRFWVFLLLLGSIGSVMATGYDTKLERKREEERKSVLAKNLRKIAEQVSESKFPIELSCKILVYAENPQVIFYLTKINIAGMKAPKNGIKLLTNYLRHMTIAPKLKETPKKTTVVHAMTWPSKKSAAKGEEKIISIKIPKSITNSIKPTLSKGGQFDYIAHAKNAILVYFGICFISFGGAVKQDHHPRYTISLLEEEEEYRLKLQPKSFYVQFQEYVEKHYRFKEERMKERSDIFYQVEPYITVSFALLGVLSLISHLSRVFYNFVMDEKYIARIRPGQKKVISTLITLFRRALILTAILVWTQLMMHQVGKSKMIINHKWTLINIVSHGVYPIVLFVTLLCEKFARRKQVFIY
ncbi:MAG: hypothetical protein ACPGC9_01035 [Cytophagales bacterium]